MGKNKRTRTDLLTEDSSEQDFSAVDKSLFKRLKVFEECEYNLNLIFFII